LRSARLYFDVRQMAKQTIRSTVTSPAMVPSTTGQPWLCGLSSGSLTFGGSEDVPKPGTASVVEHA
jgi:hypothetical protein